VHLLCSTANRHCTSGCTISRDNRWLIHYDLVVLDNDGIRGTEVNSYFLCKETEKAHERWFLVVNFSCRLLKLLISSEFSETCNLPQIYLHINSFCTPLLSTFCPSYQPSARSAGKWENGEMGKWENGKARECCLIDEVRSTNQIAKAITSTNEQKIEKTVVTQYLVTSH
jgi:hypothetical protein